MNRILLLNLLYLKFGTSKIAPSSKNPGVLKASKLLNVHHICWPYFHHYDCVQHSSVGFNSPICSSVVLNVAKGCQLGSYLQCGAPLWLLWLTGGWGRGIWGHRGVRAGRRTSDCWHICLHRWRGNHNPAYQCWQSINPHLRSPPLCPWPPNYTIAQHCNATTNLSYQFDLWTGGKLLLENVRLNERAESLFKQVKLES